MAEFGFENLQLGIEPKNIKMGYVRGPSVTPPKNLGVAIGNYPQIHRNHILRSILKGGYVTNNSEAKFIMAFLESGKTSSIQTAILGSYRDSPVKN